MATLSSVRVPIKVQHSIDNNNNNNSESYYYRTTSRGHSPPPPPLSSTAQQYSSSIHDGTDSIKQRMKEFEDRCNRWREDFFTRNGSNLHNLSAFNEFDAPPPPPPPPTSSSYLSSGTPFSTNHETTIPSTLKTSPFTSTLHKSYVDTRDGRKIYKIEFEVGDFKDNELDITTRGNLLLVKGAREVKVGPTIETKTFNREISLPEYVSTNNLNAYLIGKVLTVEADINNDVYFQRRSNINSTPSSPPLSRNIDYNNNNSILRSNNTILSSPSKTYESAKNTSQVNTSTSSTSHYSSSKTSKNITDSTYSTIGGLTQPSITSIQPSTTSTQPFTPQFSTTISTNTNSKIVPAAPEVVSGYPIFLKDDNCRVYKFDLKGFDQRDINLSITANRTLEIKASKEINDSIGKSYREFKREIHLEDNVNIDAITNSITTEGILTLKIPYISQQQQQQQQINLNSSLNNTNLKTTQLTSTSLKNLNEINNNNTNTTITSNFREYFSNDGKLSKLTYDFNEYEPENIKIFLTTNNELKITAQINDPNKSNRIQKQCFRQYNLPSHIQPEQMRAVMSRDGLLTIDFKGATQQQQQNNQQQQQQFDQNHRVFLKA